MAELALRDRLQPSLLDRLTDQRPDVRGESVEDRVLTRRQLREAVLRDLAWLFNATRPEPEPASSRSSEIEVWRPFADARRSVVNFGMPAFAGVTKSTMNKLAMENAIKQAIETFEPRIDPRSLSVTIDVDPQHHHNALQLTIRGDLWAQPVPLELLLAANVELETGNAQLRDLR